MGTEVEIIDWQVIENFVEKLSLEKELEVWMKEYAEKIESYKNLAKNKLDSLFTFFKGTTNE
jgi:hypothetical protein|nr:MAG TPA: hypothetical protein [Caudoviricetes sp.]